MNWKTWLAVLLIVVCGPSLFWNYGTLETNDTLVKSKEVKDGKYMVYTEAGVYQVRDTWWFFNFNSSDLYNKLDPNKTYKIQSNGMRIGFLSTYQNIIDVN